MASKNIFWICLISRFNAQKKVNFWKFSQKISFLTRASGRSYFEYNFYFLREQTFTLIGQSWKTHPETCPKFQFSGGDTAGFYGKLIQYFFEFSISGTWARTFSGKLIHKNFMSTYSVFVKYRGMSQTVYWKINLYLDEQNWIGTHKFWLDQFSVNWSSSNLGSLPIRVKL